MLVLPVAAGEFASLEDEHWSITEAGDGGGGGGAGAGEGAAVTLLPDAPDLPALIELGACRSVTSTERTFWLTGVEDFESDDDDDVAVTTERVLATGAPVGATERERMEKNDDRAVCAPLDRVAG